VFALSGRRAAGLVKITRKTLVYRSRPPSQEGLRMRLREPALHQGWAHSADQGTQEAGAALADTDAESNAAQSEVEHGPS